MLQRFLAHATEQHLFSDRGEVLLAVSGGRDSVAMADIAHRCGIRFAIAHCNFHLRPDECDRDQLFVRDLASSLGVPFFTVDFDTHGYATEKGLSVEEAARRLRYRWFGEIVAANGFNAVATAHHRDDSVETFFLNLFRGTGIAGLHGILPKTVNSEWQHPLTIVRPMLCFSRAEIDAYVLERNLAYVDDSTNALLDFRRNRLRLQLMPLLREMYPAVDVTMENNISRLRDAEVLLDDYVSTLRAELVRPFVSRLLPPALGAVAVDLTALALRLNTFGHQPSAQRSLLYELFRPFGFNAAIVSDILCAVQNAQSGRQFMSHTHLAEVHRGKLLVAPAVDPAPPAVSFSDVDISPEIVQRKAADFGSGQVEYLDADKVRGPLCVRQWHDGDRFRPLGMRGSRLVSDFLKDCGLSIMERRHTFVVADAADCPVWVVGLRIDDRCRISASTTHVLRAAVVGVC